MPVAVVEVGHVGMAVDRRGVIVRMLVGPFLAHDAQRVGGGVPHVNHQRLAAAAGGPDVGAKPLPLPFAILLDTVVVKSRLADRNDLGVVCKPYEFLYRHVGHVGIIRVDTDRSVNMSKTLGNCPYPWKIFERHADAKCMRYLMLAHRRDDGVEPFRELRKIEMAMRINEHYAEGSRCAARSRSA